MPKHSHSDIPIRFQRAARRAAFLKWTLRLTLPPLTVAVAISLILLWQHRPQPGVSPGVEGSNGTPPPPRVPLNFTLRNQAIELGPLTMAMEKIAVTQSIPGLARREIDSVEIPHLVAALNWHTPSDESFREQLTLLTGEKPTNIKRLVVKTGELTVTPPGSSAIQLPFTLTAKHEEDGLHRFEGSLSPDSYPLRFSGELNPSTGNGKLTASATALELNQWLGYLLPQDNSGWIIGELSAKTDLQISLLFQNYSLIWGHLDIEIAGIDTRLDPPAGSKVKPLSSRSLQAMVHSAHLTADIIDNDQQPGRPDLHYSLDLKQGRWRREKEPAKGQCETLTLKGTVRFPPASSPVHTLSGTITNSDWQGKTARVATPELSFSLPSFSNPDALRWRATAKSPSGDFQGIAVAAPTADITGSVIDMTFTTPELTVRQGDFTARCESFEGRFSSDTYLGTLGKGILSSVTQNQRAIINASTPFSFRKNKNGTMTVDMPKLTTPLLPDSPLTAVAVDISEDSVTIHGKASLDPSLLNQMAWLPEPLDGTPLSASFKLVQTDTAFFAMTIPKQTWTLKAGDWQLTTSVSGTIEADNKPGGALKCGLKTTDLTFKNDSCEIGAPTLDLIGFEWRGTAKTEAPVPSFLERPGEGNITGSITTESAKISIPPYRGHDVTIHFPFIWRGQQGFVPPDTPDKESPAIQVEKISVGKVDFSTRDLSMLPDKRAITFKTSFADTAKSVSGSLESTVTLNREPAALFRLRLACPELKKVPWLNQLPLAVLKQATYSGAMDCEASLFMDRISTAGTGALQLKDVTITNGQTFTLSGITTSIRFQELFPLTTPPGQIITLRQARLGRFSLGASQLRFQLPGSTGIYVENATAAWCGGRLQTQSVTLSSDTNSLAVEINAENLLLNQVLQAFPYLDATGTGRLNARLPLRLEDGQLRANNLVFASVGEGRLQLRDPAAFLHSLGEKPPYDKTQIEAFSDLMYDSWKLQLSSAPSPALSFTINGAVPARRKPKPFQYARQRSLPTGDLLKAVPAMFADPADTKTSESEFLE